MSGTPIMTTATQETPQDLLAWKPAGIMIVATQDCIYVLTLKAAAWGSALQSGWK